MPDTTDSDANQLYWDGREWRQGRPSEVGNAVPHGFLALPAVVLGVVGIGAWLVPPLGLAVTLLGLYLGARALNSRMKDLAVGAMALNLVFLVASALNGAVSAFHLLNDQYHWVG